MTSTSEDGQSLGKQLFAAGWRQGVLFEAHSAQFAFNTLGERAGSGSLMLATRNVKAKEILVLITQDCDIIADVKDEPFVEALICRTATPQRGAKVDRNSARYFLIDPATSLVAEARYRLQVSKATLLDLSPKPWPGGEVRHGRFVQWLGRRYDRPAIPDALYEAFQRPVEEVLAELDHTQPEVANAFSRAIHEVRITMPEHDNPPFAIEMVFLIPHNTLSEEEVNSLFTVADVIQSRLDTDLVRLDPDTRMVTDEELSVAEYLSTRPLFLEYLTYKGEQVDGAEPLPRR